MESISIYGTWCPTCDVLDADASWEHRTPVPDRSLGGGRISPRWLGATHHLRLRCRRCGATWSHDVVHKDLPVEFHAFWDQQRV